MRAPLVLRFMRTWKRSLESFDAICGDHPLNDDSVACSMFSCDSSSDSYTSSFSRSSSLPISSAKRTIFLLCFLSVMGEAYPESELAPRTGFCHGFFSCGTSDTLMGTTAVGSASEGDGTCLNASPWT